MTDAGPALGPSPLSAGDDSLSVAQARAALQAALQAAPLATVETERVPLAGALGRVLAGDLVSPMDVPPHDNSAMDGYALAGQALRAEATTVLRCVATVYAGTPCTASLQPGECVRIMTGAVMPAGLDTVVPQELCSAQGDRVSIAPGVVRAGENRRLRGEDLAQGKAALRAGRVLKPADLGLAASLGFDSLVVRRRLRVALFSTGNELLAPGAPLPAGGIYDSNRASLQAALQRLGVQVLDLGLVSDDPQALQAALGQAVQEADVVLTSGGVSDGDADYTRQMLARLGQVSFWKVAMRPGRPFAFGPLQSPNLAGPARTAWLFALPGNPVAALVSFYALAREALLHLAGATPEPLLVVRATSVNAIRKRPGRTEFQRGIVAVAADGQLQVRLTGAQGAGILRSMSEANALVVLAHEQGPVAAGQLVDVWLFDGLV